MASPCWRWSCRAGSRPAGGSRDRRNFSSGEKLFPLPKGTGCTIIGYILSVLRWEGCGLQPLPREPAGGVSRRGEGPFHLPVPLPGQTWLSASEGPQSGEEPEGWQPLSCRREAGRQFRQFGWQRGTFRPIAVGREVPFLCGREAAQPAERLSLRSPEGGNPVCARLPTPAGCPVRQMPKQYTIAPR